jgi:hypothetical protein
MDDLDWETEDSPWIAGFEGDRRVVLAKLGPYQRLFARPRHYIKRFHHRVYELIIEDWELPLETPTLGNLCAVTARLDIRFQPTLAFAREHVEHLDHLGEHIRQQYRCLLKDGAEAELRALESVDWLESGHATLERSIESLIHELLAIRDIQSRCRCHIETTFGEIDPDRLDEDVASADPARQGIALQILKRRRDTLERAARERHEELMLEQRLDLEQKRKWLELLREETALLHDQQLEKVRQAREALLADETREAEKIESEIRLKRERLRLEAELKHVELEARLEEKNERSSSYDELRIHLEREIELLAMERQRLSLEEEIHKTKLDRARGWVVGATKRFSLGKDKENVTAVEGNISHGPGKG